MNNENTDQAAENNSSSFLRVAKALGSAAVGFGIAYGSLLVLPMIFPALTGTYLTLAAFALSMVIIVGGSFILRLFNQTGSEEA